MDDLIGGAIGIVGWACCGLLKCMMKNCDQIHVNCACPTSAFGACFRNCCSHVWRCMSTISPCACCQKNAGEAYNACRLCFHTKCVLYCCACDRTCCICCDLCCPSMQLFGGNRNAGNNGNRGRGHAHGHAHNGHNTMGTGGTLILIDGGSSGGGMHGGGNNGKAGPSQQEMDEQKRQRAQQQEAYQQGMLVNTNSAYSPAPGQSPTQGNNGIGWGAGGQHPHNQPEFMQQQQGPQSPSFFQPQPQPMMMMQQQPMPPAVVEAQFESFSPQQQQQPQFQQMQQPMFVAPAPQAQAAW